MTTDRLIDAADRGFTLGDGLFETLAATDGRLRDVAAHLDRMAAGCAALGLPGFDRPAAEALLREAASGVAGVAAVRLTLTAGSGGRGLDRPAAPKPLMAATAAASPRPRTAARLATASVRRNDGSPASRWKTLSYLDNVLARAEARAAGADEALMLNTRGQVACAAAANVFWMADGVLHTPSLACGVLAGVTRAQVIAAAKGAGLTVRETAAGPEAIAAAEAVMISNSLIGLRPVSALDGRALPESPVCEILNRAIDVWR